MCYFDNAATTSVSYEAFLAMKKAALSVYANPSSLHSFGYEAERLLEDSRFKIASALGCDSSEIYFTSGGTEANNWAVFSSARLLRRKGRHLVTTGIEHPSVLEAMKALVREGFELDIVPPEQNGSINLEKFAGFLRPDTIFVSMMLINNEIGTLLPVKEAGLIVKKLSPHAIFHTDAVQAFLKMDFSPKSLGADLLSISAHKIHGPKGTGCLYIKKGLKLPPLLYGGHQQGGLRPGTEALPSIAGFAAAAGQETTDAYEINKYIRNKLLCNIPDIIFISPPDASPYILNLSLPGCPGEVIVRILESHKVYVSTGSACAKGKKSDIIAALNLGSKIADGAVRISFCGKETLNEADRLIDALIEAYHILKK